MVSCLWRSFPSCDEFAQEHLSLKLGPVAALQSLRGGGRVDQKHGLDVSDG